MRPTNIGDLVIDISKIENIKKLLGFRAMANGFVALFAYEDGNAYELEIRPARYAKNKDLLPNKKKLDKNNTILLHV